MGRFNIVRLLGAGGMGAVYEARDPQLDRSVALKLLPGDVGGEHLRHRLVREAQALAQLQHPNVVGVHEVGVAGDRVFIVMELIDGVTLDRHLKQRPHDWRDVVELFIQAGRGLIAAHAKSIVHRDFKPGNVLVDGERRVRVSDFGLARLARPDPFETPSGVTQAPADSAVLGDTPHFAGAHDTEMSPRVAAESLTDASALFGTPRYMAPEQFERRPATAQSDQFSFCVALWEALVGEHPFAAGDHLGGLAATVPGARPRKPPRGRAPRSLLQVIRRGLCAEPTERHPSMAALVSALTTVPLRRRRLAIGATGGAVAAIMFAGAVALFVTIGSSAPVAETCSGGTSMIATAWPDRATAVRRLAQLGPYGPAAAERVGAQLDDYATRWVAEHRDACLSHRRGLQSAELLDRRMACLDRGRGALAALAGVVDSTDHAALPGTVLAAHALPDPDGCANTDALLAAVPPPPPEKAARAEEIAAVLDRAQVLVDARRHEDAEKVATAAVASARDLDHRPLIARALLIHGVAATTAPTPSAHASQIFAEAVRIGIEVGDDSLAVEAWARSAREKGTASDATERALEGLDFALGLASRPGVSAFARALLYGHIGVVKAALGHRSEALPWVQRALAEAVHARGPRAFELMTLNRQVARLTEEEARREAIFIGTEAKLAAVVGREHPETMGTRLTRALWVRSAKESEELLRGLCEEYEALHPWLFETLQCWNEAAFLAAERGDFTGAALAGEHAARVRGAAPRAMSDAAAHAALWRGDTSAVERFATVVALMPRTPDDPWWTRNFRGEAELGLGRARRKVGDVRGARQALEAAEGDLLAAFALHGAPSIERRLARARAELAAISGAHR